MKRPGIASRTVAGRRGSKPPSVRPGWPAVAAEVGRRFPDFVGSGWVDFLHGQIVEFFGIELFRALSERSAQEHGGQRSSRGFLFGLALTAGDARGRMADPWIDAHRQVLRRAIEKFFEGPSGAAWLARPPPAGGFPCLATVLYVAHLIGGTLDKAVRRAGGKKHVLRCLADEDFERAETVFRWVSGLDEECASGLAKDLLADRSPLGRSTGMLPLTRRLLARSREDLRGCGSEAGHTTVRRRIDALRGLASLLARGDGRSTRRLPSRAPRRVTATPAGRSGT